ncbi:hypothetical protein RCL1_008527 [Eukaryota sp. TZLM3-RCL]
MYKLFVGQVPKNYTESDLEQLFNKYGSIQEVALVKDRRTGTSRGCCFVRFTEKESAEQAISELHNKLQLPSSRHPLQIRFANGPDKDSSGNIIRPKYEPTPDTARTKLFVGMLGRNITELQLHMIFSQFGDLDEVVLLRDPTGRSRRCAFVRLFSKEAAVAAVAALNNRIQFEDAPAPCVCKFAAEDEESETIETKQVGHSTDEQEWEEGPPGANLLIYGLQAGVTEEQLKSLFSDYGTVVSIGIYHSWSSTGEIYYARVSFNTTEAASAAFEELNGKTIDGAPMTIMKKRVQLPK